MRRDFLMVAGVIGLVILAAVTTASPYETNTASANGATRKVVNNARAGPYELQVGVLPGSPKVGNLHLSIQVKDAADGSNITDAIIMVMATGPAGATYVSPVQATNTPQRPQAYDVDISLDIEGSWILTLEMDSDLGKADLEVPLEVREPGGFNLFFPIAVAAVALSFVIWGWNGIRGRLRRRNQ